MKYKQGKFLQLSRDIFKDDKFMQLNTTAKWLYFVLCELEHKFTGPKEDFFFRSNEDLSKDANLSMATLKRAKRELKESGYIKTFQVHWKGEDGKLSRKHITGYRITEV